MIHTSMQLKAKVRNLAQGDSTKSQTLIRNFIMERFLERVSLSEYKDNFVLKGGMLVAAVVGLDTRATMDIDTTIRAMSFSQEEATKIVEEILTVEIEDGVSFGITKVTDIMEEHDYPGIRFMLEAKLDRLKQAIKIDISIGDIITPDAVEYDYKLMFEDRTIPLWSYNLETLLAEKLETIMARGTANTRMRDFYDIQVLSAQEEIDGAVLKEAFLATSNKRGSQNMLENLDVILQTVAEDETMQRLWKNYAHDSFYVGDLAWEDVMESVAALAETVK